MKKWFFCLLLVLPLLVKAQGDSTWYGMFEIDCNKYVLERLVARDTMFGNMSAAILGPKVTTLLVQKTAITDKLPDSIGGYRLKYVDVENIQKADYKLLQDGTASIFYMSQPQSRYAYHDIYLMPMHAVKKGRHIHAEYTGKGCKSTFFMDYSKSRFMFDKTSCF